jgi:hypothetical protein
MKYPRTKPLVLFSLFTILIISASSFPNKINSTNVPPAIQINRLDDGTSIVTENENGFKFNALPGWYPLSIPPSPDEIADFATVIQQNNIPLSQDWGSNMPADIMRLAFVDLDSKHYENDSANLAVLVQTDITKLAPNQLVVPIIEFIKLSGIVTNSKIVEISKQKVGVVQFSTVSLYESYFTGKIILFIKKGKLFAFFGVTNREELLPNIEAIMDKIINSLEFSDVK